MSCLFVEASVGVTNNQLNLAAKRIVNVLGKNLKDLIKIPDQKFKKGKVFDFNVIRVKSPDVNVSLQGSTLNIEITDLDIEFNPKWDIRIQIKVFRRTLNIRASGSLSVKATGIGIKLKLDINTFKVIGCEDLIKSISLKFSGRNIPSKISNFIAKTFNKLVSRRLKKILQGKICKAVERFFDKYHQMIVASLELVLRPPTTPSVVDCKAKGCIGEKGEQGDKGDNK